MSWSRSEPERWIVRGELDLLVGEMAVRVVGEQPGQDSREFSGVRSSWDMLARNSDLYWEAGRQQRGLVLQFGVGALQLRLLLLEFVRALLELGGEAL